MTSIIESGKILSVIVIPLQMKIEIKRLPIGRLSVLFAYISFFVSFVRELALFLAHKFGAFPGLLDAIQYRAFAASRSTVESLLRIFGGALGSAVATFIISAFAIVIFNRFVRKFGGISLDCEVEAGDSKSV